MPPGGFWPGRGRARVRGPGTQVPPGAEVSAGSATFFKGSPLCRGENHQDNHRQRVYLLGTDVFDDFTNFCRRDIRNFGFTTTFVKPEVVFGNL